MTGYELTVPHREGTSIDALLYLYEGVANKDGISISGRIAGGKLAMEGDWVEHLIEYPSKLNSHWFQGTITITDLATPTDVRLKRVGHIWMCKG